MAKCIDVDVERAIKGFNNLTSKKQEKITKAGLIKGGNMIRKGVQKNVYSAIKNKGVKFADMYNGITVKYHPNIGTVKVSVMGTKKYYYSFITRFFAVGAKERQTKKYKGSSFKYTRKRKSNKPSGYKGNIIKVNLFAGTNEDKVYKSVDDTVRSRLRKLYND